MRVDCKDIEIASEHHVGAAILRLQLPGAFEGEKNGTPNNF